VTAWRLAELRQVLLFVCHAREAIRARDLPRAFRWHRLAVQGLYVLRGMAVPGGNPCATAGLHRVVSNLGDAIEAALRPAPAADPVDLLEDIAAGVRVLRVRDGLDVSEEAVYERARNILTALLASNDVRVREVAARKTEGGGICAVVVDGFATR
jgi:hypothetical protein